MFISMQQPHYNPYVEKQHKVPFFYGQYYPVYVALAVVFFYLAELQYVGLAFLSVVACVVVIECDDLTPLLPPLFFCTMTFNDMLSLSLVPILIIVSPFVVCFILHFFIHRPKKFVLGSLFFPLLFVSVALFLGGIFSNENYNVGRGVVSAVCVGPLLLIVYLVFLNNIHPPKCIDIKRQICYYLSIAGCILFVEIINLQIRRYVDGIYYVNFGWGNVNSAAVLLMVSIGATWYLLIRARRTIPCLLVLAVLYVGVFLSDSDGCIGISVVFAPVYATVAYFKLERYRRTLYFGLVCAAAIVLLLIVLLGIPEFNFANAIEALLIKLSNDNARTSLYREAMNLFKQNPFFGVGLGYESSQFEMMNSPLLAYNFHSTIVHVAATMGVFGIIAYSVYFSSRYQILMKKFTLFNSIAVLAFTTFTIYGFIDTCEFTVMPDMIIVTVFITVVEITNKLKDNSYKPLPLLLNMNNAVIA